MVSRQRELVRNVSSSVITYRCTSVQLHSGKSAQYPREENLVCNSIAFAKYSASSPHRRNTIHHLVMAWQKQNTSSDVVREVHGWEKCQGICHVKRNRGILLLNQIETKLSYARNLPNLHCELVTLLVLTLRVVRRRL